MSLYTLSIPGILPFFSSDRTMRIRVPGSTSATESLLSSVSVTLSWSESNGVKWYEELPRTYLCDQSVISETDDSQCRRVSFDTFGEELGLLGVSLGSLVT